MTNEQAFELGYFWYKSIIVEEKKISSEKNIELDLYNELKQNDFKLCDYFNIGFFQAKIEINHDLYPYESEMIVNLSYQYRVTNEGKKLWRTLMMYEKYKNHFNKFNSFIEQQINELNLILEK